MGRLNNFDNNPNGTYFAAGGNEDNDGLSQEKPKLLPQSAITVLGGGGQVTASQGGDFTTTVVLNDGMVFDAPGGNFVINAPVSITMASLCLANTLGVFNDEDDGICWLIDNESRVGIRTLFTNPTGNDGVGFKITGACESVFITTDQMRMDGLRTVGFDVDASSPDPINITSDSLIIEEDDQTVVRFNPPDSTILIVNASAITMGPGASGSTAYDIQGGICIIRLQGELNVDTAIHVRTGAIAILNCEDVNGDIIVDSGALLLVDIQRHTGTITNNGTLEGEIGSTTFQPVTINGLKTPNTTAILTLITGGLNGGTSKTFITNQDPKGDIPGTPGDFAVRVDGVNTRIYQHRGASGNDTDWVNISDSKRETVLLASSFVDQPLLPGGITTDQALQITFGAAQFGPTDPVELSAAGAMTANITDQYYFDATVQFGRTGAGAASQLFFRTLVNGVQEGESVFAKIDNSNTNLSTQMNSILDLTAGAVVTFEFIRDSSGFDSGSLFTDNPTAAGWNNSPSAHIHVSRRILL